MIIDAHTHITPDGAWFNTEYKGGIENLLRQMDVAHVDKACIISLPGYIENDFVLKMAQLHADRLLPVASFDPSSFAKLEEVNAELRRQFENGPFLGIKLHPRLNRYDLLDERVSMLFDEVSNWKKPLAIWIDTYLYYPGARMKKGPVEAIQEVVGRYSNLTFFLSHAGWADVLRLSSAIRSCHNAFLDMSLVLTTFLGSSVEMDIRYLFNNFEKRMVFGSDFPEVDIPYAVNIFKKILEGTKSTAAKDIMGENFKRLLL